MDDILFGDSTSKKYLLADDKFKSWSQDNKVLNLYGQNISNEKFFYEYEQADQRPNQQVAFDLKDVIGDIYSSHLNEDGSGVDYKGIESSEAFKTKFLPLVVKLAYADLSSIVSKDDEIRALFINLYNVLNIHANIAKSKNSTSYEKGILARASFFSTWGYCIGG